MTATITEKQAEQIMAFVEEREEQRRFVDGEYDSDYEAPLYNHVIERHPNVYAIPMLSPMCSLHVFIDPDAKPREGDALAMGRATNSSPRIYALFQPQGESTYSLLPCVLDVVDRKRRDGLEIDEVVADCWGVVVWFQPKKAMA